MSTNNLHLITHRLCPFVQRSVILLEEKEIPFSRTDIDLANKPDWFKRISPLDNVPVLQVNDHTTLFESAVICEYLDEITPGSLHPQNPLDKAHHRAWIEFGSAILTQIAALYSARDKETFDRHLHTLGERFATLETEIKGTPYFSGETFCLVDAVYGPIFRYFEVFGQFLALDIFDQLPRVRAWHRALLNRPSVQRAVAPEYPQLLLEFLANKDSYLSQFIPQAPQKIAAH